MASPKSYKITLKNNATEKEAKNLVLNADVRFMDPDLESRKQIMELLNIEARFSRAFDLVFVEDRGDPNSSYVYSDPSELTLVEIKSTMKELASNPYGFFFGATENEFNLARQMGDQYRFCFVCLHPATSGFKLVTLPELELLIKNKRTQYQINLHNPPA